MVCTTVPMQGLLALDHHLLGLWCCWKKFIDNSSNQCGCKYASIAQCVYEYSLSIIYSLRCVCVCVRSRMCVGV